MANKKVKVIEEIPVEKKNGSVANNLEVDRINYEEQLKEDIKNKNLVQEKLKEKKDCADVVDVPKKKYLECPFCHDIEYALSSKDVTANWCPKCGKCYEAIWK